MQKITGRTSLEEHVVHELREAILNGQIPPGSRLVQDQLAEQLGVSRLPVRNAIKALVGLGLIEVSPTGAASVAPFQADDVREVFQLRSILEGTAVRLTAPRLDQSDFATLFDLLGQMDGALALGQFDVYTATNAAFHYAIYRRCGSRRLEALIRQMWNGFPRYSNVIMGRVRQSHAEHHEILAALRAGDTECAARVITEHINGTCTAICAYLEHKALQA
jgi:DNA-binding GntR family transcriptional regulator